MPGRRCTTLTCVNEDWEGARGGGVREDGSPHPALPAPRQRPTPRRQPQPAVEEATRRSGAGPRVAAGGVGELQLKGVRGERDLRRLARAHVDGCPWQPTPHPRHAPARPSPSAAAHPGRRALRYGQVVLCDTRDRTAPSQQQSATTATFNPRSLAAQTSERTLPLRCSGVSRGARARQRRSCRTSSALHTQ